jgi:collagenase-like PrtC family protease
MKSERQYIPSAPRVAFSIPSFFTPESLTAILELVQGEKAVRTVNETYGCLSYSLLGHGRPTGVVPRIQSFEKLALYRQFSETKNIRFNYLLNAPYSPARLPTKTAKQHIAQVLSEVQPHSVTISSIDILKIVRELSPHIPVNISTIAGIRTAEDLKPYLQFGPRVVVPHHDLARDFASLKALNQFARISGVRVQMLVNESCVFGCAQRAAHYEQHTSGKKDDRFQSQCNAVKYGDPAAFLECVWIRPEDIEWLVTEFGIVDFKISGREKPQNWLPEVVTAYLRGSYRGNLIRMLAITPPWVIEPCDELYVDNLRLDGFFANLPRNSRSERRAYCERWAQQLIASGAMSITGVKSGSWQRR